MSNDTKFILGTVIAAIVATGIVVAVVVGTVLGSQIVHNGMQVRELAKGIAEHREGAALLRRPFSPLFMGVVARRGCLFGSFCGGQASGQASIGSLSRRQPDGIRLRCGTAPPNTPVWTFPRRSGSVSWEGRFCDGCGGIRLSGCSRSVVCGGWRRLRRGPWPTCHRATPSK